MANIIRYRLRTDEAANWTESNPVLLGGEPGFDSTAGRLKWGDGATAWNDLPYIGPQVVDDLTTGGADKVLSAEQGKVLKGLVDAAGVGDGIGDRHETWTFTLADGSILTREVASWISET